MKRPLRQLISFKRIGLILGFAGAILIVTTIAMRYGSITNPATVAFTFLILVLLSAFFADVAVAISTSLVATLCFNFFFLEPIGTFRIAALQDWISLFAFLFTAIVISRLTASAWKYARNSEVLDMTVKRLNEFALWLLSIPREGLDLSKIAAEAVRIFSLQYCSIHVHTEERWLHFLGNPTAELSRLVENSLKSVEEQPPVTGLIDERSLGVRYSQIFKELEPRVVLVVKSDDLSANALNTIVCMINILVPEILQRRGPFAKG